MGFNWKSAIGFANSLKNPKQIIDYLLNACAKNDQQMANSLKQMIYSGQDASKVLGQLASEGKITLEQLKQIRKAYGMARAMGLKHQISNSDWESAAKIIKSNTKLNSSGSNGFNGF